MIYDKDIPIFEIIVEYDDNSGFIRNSFVDRPAVEHTKIAFSEEDTKYVFSEDKKEQMFMSVSILADTPILRKGPDGEPFYVVFSKDTVRTILNKLVKQDKMNEVTLYHDDSKVIDDIYMVESFIVEKGRVESPVFDVPDGSLITTYWVPDADKYEMLLNDPNFNGFSIEINAKARLVDMFSSVYEEEFIISKIKSLLKSDFPDDVKEAKIKKLIK